MAIYMKFEGIKGSATGKHQGWIKLESCNMGLNNTFSNPRGNDREREKTSINEIIITKFSDSSSQLLFQETANGQGRKVTIDFTEKDDENPYLSIELENVFISSYNINGRGSNENKPLESLSLIYVKINYITKSTTTSNESPNMKNKVIWDSRVGSKP